MSRHLVVLVLVLLCSPLLDAYSCPDTPRRRRKTNPLPVDPSASAPQLDPYMQIDPSKDVIPDKYPTGFLQFVDCDPNIPAAEVVNEVHTNLHGFTQDAPTVCPNGAGRQIVFNDEFPVPMNTRTNTPRATYWGIKPNQFAKANMTSYADPYIGVRPSKVRGRKLPVIIWPNGLQDHDLEYTVFTHKPVSSRGWFSRRVASHPGDWSWQYITPATGWAQQNLIQKYRVHDIDRAVQLLIQQNRDPSHAYYNLIDETRIYIWGHSSGAAGALQAWKGSSFFGFNPISYIAGVLPLLDPGMWQYQFADLVARFFGALFAGIWSENQFWTQRPDRMHSAVGNQSDINNHVICEGTVHENFQAVDCQLSWLSNYTGAIANVTAFWSYPGLASAAYCVSPPFDHFSGPLLPKMAQQDLINIVHQIVDRFLEAVERDSEEFNKVQFSTAAMKHWQQHDLPNPGMVKLMGRWTSGNITLSNEPEDDFEMRRTTDGYYRSYGDSAGESYVTVAGYFVDSPGVQIYGINGTDPDGDGTPAVTLVDPTWAELVADPNSGCATGPLC